MLEVALYGQVLLWFAVTIAFLLTRQATMFHPLSVYLLFHALVFVIRPLCVHYLNFNAEWLYMGLEPSAEHQIRALAASSLGLMVFAICSVAAGWSATEFRTATPQRFTPAQKRALIVATIMLAPVILYSIHSLLSGGLQIENRGNTYVMAGASGYTLEAQYMAGPLLCAWLAVTRFRWPALLVLIPYLGYRAYCGMSRWTIVLMFLAIALVYGWQTRKKLPPAWALACVVPVFLLFRMIGDNRQFFHDLISGSNTDEISEPAARPDWKERYDNPDFANFDFLAYVVSIVPERTGTYTYGAQYLQLFTEPIPRKLWPDKPVGSPVRSFNLNNYGNFLGMTVSLVGDGWNSGGWLGVALTLGMVGFVLGRAHRWFWKNTESNMASLCYLVGLAMLPQWYRDGSISIAKFLFWNLSPLLFWMLLSWWLAGGKVAGYSIVLPGTGRVRLIRTGSMALRGNSPVLQSGSPPASYRS